MTNVVDIVLITLIAATAFAIIRVRNLFAVTMLFGIFSLLSASLFVLLDAVDVALTEAAVGAGISVVLLLGTLMLVGKEERVAERARRPWLALAVVGLTGAGLIYATLDMPHFGDPQAPAHQHVAPYYIEVSPDEIGIPNMVTSVLASYRGFDTLGEVMVIYAAGVGVLLLLGAGAVRRLESGRDSQNRAYKGTVGVESGRDSQNRAYKGTVGVESGRDSQDRAYKGTAGVESGRGSQDREGDA